MTPHPLHVLAPDLPEELLSEISLKPTTVKPHNTGLSFAEVNHSSSLERCCDKSSVLSLGGFALAGSSGLRTDYHRFTDSPSLLEPPAGTTVALAEAVV